MRWYLGPEGDQRLWFEPDEIEMIIEDELRKSGLRPTAAAPITELERFIEGHLGAELDQYAPLEPDVLGLTLFVPGKPAAISINSTLTAAALDDEEASRGRLGRFRATLAHEAGHVVLHRVLFELRDGQRELFGSTGKTARGLMRCLKRDVGPRSHASDWREIQANRAMAALLMPRRLFKTGARLQLTALGIAHPEAGSNEAVAAARGLADMFAVSEQAASIRLETLGLVVPPGTTPFAGV